MNDGRSIAAGPWNALRMGYFYACGDSKGIAFFSATNTGLNTFSGETSFQYFGYCDNPASVAYFGNNNSYPLDYIAATGSGFSLSLGSLELGRHKEMTLPGINNQASGAVSVKPITSINCTTPTPNANVSDLIFRDNEVTDYGVNYPLGKARPFLLFTTQVLPVNSLVRVTNLVSPTPPEDYFHIVVNNVRDGGNGLGSLLMPIITEGITMPL